jgi:hypothetical protein
VATTGFAEVLENPPLVYLASDADEMIAYLRELSRVGFRDGHEALRWKTSLGETWEAPAALMIQVLTERQCRQASKPVAETMAPQR